MEHGEPGHAARKKAEDAARAAEHLERKATNARKVSKDWAAGAAGEEAVAQAISPLSAEGWFMLHDRVMPAGGNIDHIVVGPGSVIVLDAKAWNGELSVRNGRLYNGTWNQDRALAKLAAQREAVSAALGSDGPVDMALVITTQPAFGPQAVGEAVVLGVGHLLEAVQSSRTSYSSAQVDSMVSILLDAFPAAGTVPPAATGLQQVDGVEVGELFDRANRFFLLNQWKRYGKHRIYLRDEDGEQYGFKNVLDGTLHLDHPNDEMVEVVLRSATQTGLKLAQRDVPKLRIPVVGGRLLGLFGRLYCSAIVGFRWQSKGKDLLYGTLINPTDGILDLGYVDLATGWIKPASQGPLTRDRGPAERYLALLRDRNPFNATP
ncbi:MAG: nuclease-related domain-containing protein [Microthrixaceae bacterium]